MKLINLKATEAYTDNDGDHITDIALLHDVNPRERFGFGLTFDNCTEALEAYEASKYDNTLPVTLMLESWEAAGDGNDVSALRKYIDGIATSIVVTLTNFLPTISENVLARKSTIYRATSRLESDMAAWIDARDTLTNAIEAARVIVTTAGPAHTDWSADEKAMRDAYRVMHEAAYLEEAEELKGAITQHGLKRMQDLRESFEARIADVRKSRYVVVGQYHTRKSDNSVSFLGYRVMDTNTLHCYEIKSRASGDMRVNTREFTYNALARAFIEPTACLHYHHNHAHKTYSFKVLPIKSTEITFK